jgi:8-hydroxy-5-deazaflavin:NADPH oxidoreductase
MKIGILGVGFIGATLVRKLSAAGHHVLVANSRGPDTIRELADEAGATAVTAADAVKDVDVIILSVPLGRMQPLKDVLADVPVSVPVIDTSNYYPLRDGHFAAIDEGQIESEWVQELIGRPVTKAWNAVLAGTLRKNGKPAGDPQRTAIPVAGDAAKAKQIAMELVEATGFDAVDVGTIAESWRIQPGNPTYCNELTADELRDALIIADRSLAPRRRDAGMQVMLTFGDKFDNDDLLRVNRAVTRVSK